MFKLSRGLIKNKVLIIGGVIGLITGVATTSVIYAASGSIPTANGQLNTCYNNTSLVLSVSATATCATGNTAVSWTTNPPLVGGLTNQTYNNLDWQYMNLPVENFSGSTFVAPSLSGTNFKGSNFSSTTVQYGSANNAVFTNNNFTNASLTGISVNSSTFAGANLTGATINSVTANNANFNRVNFTNANLKGSDLTGSTFSNATWNNTTCPDGTLSTTDGSTCVNNL